MKKQHLPVLALLCILTACGTSSEPDYFSLATKPGEINPGINTTVEIQRPLIADYLDRPDFVYQDGPYRISIDSTDNWAEPLDTMFARILASDLRQRLPLSRITTEDNSSANTRFSIDMNLQRFNPTQDNILLEGELTISDKNATTAAHAIPIHMTVDGRRSPEAIAAGMSQLISDLSDNIVSHLVALQ